MHSYTHSFAAKCTSKSRIELKNLFERRLITYLAFFQFSNPNPFENPNGEWEGEEEEEGAHNCLDTCATCRVAFSNCNPQFVGLHARMGPTNIGSTCDAYYAIIAMNTMNANTNMNMNIPLLLPMSVVVFSRHLRIIQI